MFGYNFQKRFFKHFVLFRQGTQLTLSKIELIQASYVGHFSKSNPTYFFTIKNYVFTQKTLFVGIKFTAK